MGVVRTPVALIDVLDSEGKITGHEIENHYTYEPEGQNDPMAKLFQTAIKRDPATEEEMAVFRSDAGETMTAAFAALNVQIQDERDAAEEAKKEAAKEFAAAIEAVNLQLEEVRAAGLEAVAAKNSELKTVQAELTACQNALNTLQTWVVNVKKAVG